MNSYLLLEDPEKPGINGFMIKGLLITLLSFTLLLGCLLMLPAPQRQQPLKSFSGGIVQASLTAITRLPTHAQHNTDVNPKGSDINVPATLKIMIKTCGKKVSTSIRVLSKY